MGQDQPPRLSFPASCGQYRPSERRGDGGAKIHVQFCTAWEAIIEENSAHEIGLTTGVIAYRKCTGNRHLNSVVLGHDPSDQGLLDAELVLQRKTARRNQRTVFK